MSENVERADHHCNSTDIPSFPVSSSCRLFVDGLLWALGMKFAVEQINNSTSLLPGVKLGYDMYDTCFEPVVALQPSLLFLTRNGTRGIGALRNYTDYQPRVTAVIGPHKSDLCLVTAKLFSFFLIPQVKDLSAEARIVLFGGEGFGSTKVSEPGSRSLNQDWSSADSSLCHGFLEGSWVGH